jgi:hypothetical protein
VMICAKAAVCRARHSARIAVCEAKAAAVAASAMVEAANNQATKAVRRVPERHGDPALARPAASLAIGPRIARQAHRRVLPLLRLG